MAHGGKRKGAGRPKGALGKRDRELQNLVEQRGGLSPGRVMLESMWYHYYEAQRLMQDPTIAATDEGRKQISEMWMKAGIVAKYAAPYIHAKLAPCYSDEDDLEEIRDKVSADEKAAPARRTYTAEELRKMDSETFAKVYREAFGPSH
jgi:hypothetical protein